MFNINERALKCYNCGAKIPILKKLSLCSRNSYSINCSMCGMKNKLPIWANLWYISIAILFVVLLIVLKPRLIDVVGLCVIYGVILGIITIFFIPLTKDWT